MTERFPDFLNPVVDDTGATLSGAQLFFYSVGTSTKKNTYSDSAKTIANANPVVADSGGRFGDIFMLTDEQYKVVLALSGDTDPPSTPVKTWDNVSPVLPSGSFPVLAVSSKSTNYTVLTTDRGAVILVDASSGAVTITLLAVATAESGFSVTVKKTDSSANAVTVDGAGVETIDTATTLLLTRQNASTQIVTNGTAWFVTANASAGDVALIHSSDLSAAAASVDVFWDDRLYDRIDWLVTDYDPTTDATDFWVRVSTDGSTYLAGTQYAYHGRFDDGAVTRTDQVNQAQWVISDTTAGNEVDAAASLTSRGTISTNALEDQSHPITQGEAFVGYTNDTGAAKTVGTVWLSFNNASSTASLRGIQFLPSSSTIASGQFFVWGHRRA